MSNVEFIFKIVDLIFNFIGLVLIVFGWIIPYKQSMKEAKKVKKIEEQMMNRQWEKEFVYKQISEFYGPIAALLREDNIRFSLILYQLGRSCVFERNVDKLSDLSIEDQKVWVHYVDTYKIPTQQKILEIMEQKQYLVYKSEIPTAFKVYQEYSLGWEMLDNQKRNGVPNYYEYYYSYNFPVIFSNYIFDTLEILLKKQAELTQQNEYPSTAF